MPHDVPKVEKTKYYICVREIGGSVKQFKDCDYHYHPEKNILSIISSANVIIQFVGNFSASIISMEDFEKTQYVND